MISSPAGCRPPLSDTSTCDRDCARPRFAWLPDDEGLRTNRSTFRAGQRGTAGYHHAAGSTHC